MRARICLPSSSLGLADWCVSFSRSVRNTLMSLISWTRLLSGRRCIACRTSAPLSHAAMVAWACCTSPAEGSAGGLACRAPAAACRCVDLSRTCAAVPIATPVTDRPPADRLLMDRRTAERCLRRSSASFCRAPAPRPRCRCPDNDPPPELGAVCGRSRAPLKSLEAAETLPVASGSLAAALSTALPALPPGRLMAPPMPLAPAAGGLLALPRRLAARADSAAPCPVAGAVDGRVGGSDAVGASKLPFAEVVDEEGEDLASSNTSVLAGVAAIGAWPDVSLWRGVTNAEVLPLLLAARLWLATAAAASLSCAACCCVCCVRPVTALSASSKSAVPCLGESISIHAPSSAGDGCREDGNVSVCVPCGRDPLLAPLLLLLPRLRDQRRRPGAAAAVALICRC